MKIAIWTSKIIRWLLGLGLLALGYFFHAWEAYLLGAVAFLTGFIRPRRCIDDSCQIP